MRLFEKRMNVRRGTCDVISCPLCGFKFRLRKHCIIQTCLYSQLLFGQLLFPEPGYEFDKASLLEYNPMSFGGPPVTVETVEEADELLRNDEKESAIGIHM